MRGAAELQGRLIASDPACDTTLLGGRVTAAESRFPSA